MNAETIITAINANLGDFSQLEEKAKGIDIPGIEKIPEDILRKIKEKYVAVGTARARKRIHEFISRLHQSIEQEKEQSRIQSQKAQETQGTQDELSLDESQYKNPTGYHLRNQTSFRASIGPSVSFGGVIDQRNRKKRKRTSKEELEQKLDEAFALIKEELAIRSDDAELLSGSGRLFVDGELVINNHTDLLRILTTWLMDNHPDIMLNAISGLADMVKSGAAFKE